MSDVTRASFLKTMLFALGATALPDIRRPWPEGIATRITHAITASGGTLAPFRFVALYDDRIEPLGLEEPDDPLLAYADYGSALTLTDGETLWVEFGRELLRL